MSRALALLSHRRRQGSRIARPHIQQPRPQRWRQHCLRYQPSGVLSKHLAGDPYARLSRESPSDAAVATAGLPLALLPAPPTRARHTGPDQSRPPAGYTGETRAAAWATTSPSTTARQPGGLPLKKAYHTPRETTVGGGETRGRRQIARSVVSGMGGYSQFGRWSTTLGQADKTRYRSTHLKTTLLFWGVHI